MTFSTAIRTCFAKFITFSGRASRPEYWYFFLFCILANFVAGAIDWTFFTDKTVTETSTDIIIETSSSQPVQGLVGLVLFLPHLSAAWRRMQDTGRSGLYALLPILLTIAALGVFVFGIGLADIFRSGGSLDILFTRVTFLVLIPTLVVLLVSPLLVLWWLSRPSQPGANAYGPNPNEAQT